MDKPLRSLSRKNWINRALQKLTDEGIDKVSIAALARDLSVTKGSFYWHFKDVPDFKTKMLHHWQSSVIGALTAAVDAGGTASQRLYRINEIASTDSGSFGGAALEPAIRAWAQSDVEVADAIEEIDAKRMASLAATLKQLALRISLIESRLVFDSGEERLPVLQTSKVHS